MSGRHDEDEGPIGVYRTKEIIHDLLLQSGQKELIMAQLRQRTTMHGWSWTMRDEFVEYIKQRGSDNVNVSHMIADLAPLGRELFPGDLKKELIETIFMIAKNHFTLDENAPIVTDPEEANLGAEKTFLFQSRDVKPDPGLGIGIDTADSPPPSPSQSAAAYATSPVPSPGSAGGNSGTIQFYHSPIQSTSRHSPGAGSRLSPTSQRPISPQPLPVLRPETISAVPSLCIIGGNDDEEEEPEEVEEEEEEEEEDEDDSRNNEEEDEDELMDV